MEPVEETLLEPRGLAFGPDGSLYVNANNAHALVRAEETTGQGRFDRVTPLRKSPGGVGHGRNNLTFGPDGRCTRSTATTFACPTISGADESRVIHQENDRLLTCRWDRFLFDYAAKLPAGHLIRTTHPAASWELMAGGFRNPYGIDFNPDGELFTFDADNEGDLGTPWYRPTRINHVVSGRLWLAAGDGDAADVVSGHPSGDARDRQDVPHGHQVRNAEPLSTAAEGVAVYPRLVLREDPRDPLSAAGDELRGDRRDVPGRASAERD